jgi:YD repeat-containing protein
VNRRIIRASDSLTRSVSYSYDDLGRLVRVAASDGTIREYTYGDRNEMLTIDEPGWIIQNTFDDAGRVVRQLTRLFDPDELITWEFAYTVVDGAVVQTDMKRNGRLTRYTYNSSHYQLSETFDADGPNPVSLAYERDPGTNLMTAVTVRCQGRDGPIIRTVPATHETKDALVRQLVRLECD